MRAPPRKEGLVPKLFWLRSNAKVTGALIISLFNCFHSYHSFMSISCSLECASVSSDHTRLREILSAFVQVVPVSTFPPACLVYCPVYCSPILNHYRFGRARRENSGIQTISFFRQTNITAAVFKLRRLVFRSMATQSFRMREEGSWLME